MGPKMLSEVVLSAERTVTFVTSKGSLLRVRSDVPFEMLKAFERSPAKVPCTDEDFLACLYLGIRGDGPVAITDHRWASGALAIACEISDTAISCCHLTESRDLLGTSRSMQSSLT